MKLFVTWSPHDVSPLLSEYVDGYSVSLALFSRRKLEMAAALGLKKLLGTSKELLLDSLSMTIASASIKPYDPRSQFHMLNMQLWLRPDYIVHKDYPLLNRALSEKEKLKLLARTIRNAEVMFRLEERYGLRNVIYVIQGWDLESMAYCAKCYVELGVEMYGLGSSISLGHREFARRLRRVREIVGRHAHIHVFGALKPYHLEIVKQYANSIDTSTPIKAAAMGCILVEGGGHVRRIKVERVSLKDLRLPSHLRRELEQVIEDSNNRGEDRPPITMLKRALAAANAYVLRCALQRRT